jgi:hypothetical protein
MAGVGQVLHLLDYLVIGLLLSFGAAILDDSLSGLKGAARRDPGNFGVAGSATTFAAFGQDLDLQQS